MLNFHHLLRILDCSLQNFSLAKVKVRATNITISSVKKAGPEQQKKLDPLEIILENKMVYDKQIGSF